MREGLADVLKDFEMRRLFWIIWVSTKCNQRIPHKTERKANFTCKEEKTVWRWRLRLEWRCHKLRSAGAQQTCRRPGAGSPSQPRGEGCLGAPWFGSSDADLGLQGSRAVTEWAVAVFSHHVWVICYSSHGKHACSPSGLLIWFVGPS